MIKKRDKKGLEIDVLVWWIIGLVAFAIIMGVILVLSGKGQNTIEYFQRMLRFGR